MDYSSEFGISDIIETHADDRPQLDLRICRTPESLPPRLSTINFGVSYWAELVLGLAMDGARRQGIAPWQVHRALETGNLTARALFALGNEQEPRPLPSPEELAMVPLQVATYVGGVRARSRHLFVSGGDPRQVLSAVTYRRRQGDYIPAFARLVKPAGSGPPNVRTIPLPELYTYVVAEAGEPSPPIPHEMWTTRSLYNLAVATVAGLRAGTVAVHTDVSFGLETWKLRFNERLA